MPRPLLLLPAALLAACASLADRYEKGNAAMATPDGLAYLVLMSPLLHDAMSECIPVGAQRPAPTLLLLADVDRAGAARRVRVEPPAEGTRCMRAYFEAHAFPPPPLADGAAFFPVGLRIDLAP